MKNWKNLFVKSDEKEPEKTESKSENFSFPVGGNSSTPVQPSSYSPQPLTDPVIKEVLQVYENGLDSINMPGYDFYEFYQAITSIGDSNEQQAYKMAYQMAKTLDKTITPQKLMNDAEFYISKINEVYSQYVSQGQQKLNVVQEKKSGDKIKLTGEIDQAAMRVAHLRSELQQLESEMTLKRNTLAKIDESFYPQEKSIREKLNANDLARKTSIDKLNMIKDGIVKFIKG